MHLETLKIKGDMMFRNVENDLLSYTKSHPKDLNHRLNCYETVKPHICPCNLKEQQFVYAHIMNINVHDILSNYM